VQHMHRLLSGTGCHSAGWWVGEKMGGGSTVRVDEALYRVRAYLHSSMQAHVVGVAVQHLPRGGEPCSHGSTQASARMPASVWVREVAGVTREAVLSFTSWLVVGVHRQSHCSSIVDPSNVTPRTNLVRILCVVDAKCDTRSAIVVSFRPPRDAI
jgi:hypothetical protein